MRYLELGVMLSMLAGPVLAERAVMLPYADPAAVAAGEDTYKGHCAACHGANLEGEPNWKIRDADGYAPAPPHDVTGHTWHHPDGQLFALTKYGPAKLVGQGYRSRMPGFEDILSDQEIIDVLAYIKSTWPPEIRARHNTINANNQ